MKAFISTPYGDFDYVKSDLSLGTSCDQCVLFGLGICNEVDCSAFDSERGHYHFKFHNEKEGVS